MSNPLLVLILEDSASDAELEVYELKRAGFAPEWTRVQTEAGYLAQLRPELDLIIADYQLPQFSGEKALQLLKQSGLDIPFIIVSGALGEERAVDLMKQGVTDYLQKDRLIRLGQAAHRALEQKRDREEKARTEKALREREASYRELAERMEHQARTFDTLLSAVPDQLFLLGPDRCFTYANRALLKSWDKPLEQVIGKGFGQLGYPPELADKLAADLDRAFQGHVVRGESASPSASGRLGYYEHYLVPLFDDRQQVVAIAGASRDISERKDTEAALRRAGEAVEKQQHWLEMVLDLLPIPIMMAEPGTGRIVLSNKAADRLYGQPIPKLHPAEQFDFCDTDGRKLTAEEMPAARAARGERLEGLEALWNTSTGSYHMSFYSEILPATYGHPSVVVLLCQDIGHLKQTETSLRESIEQLQRERELREIFVSTLSHDLRTPLISARMSAELLARGQAAAKAPMLQGRIIENIDRLDGMIQTLLDANLVRAGERLPLQLQRCELRQTIRDVLDELTTVHGDRYRLRAPAAIEGCWDPRLLKRILENLLNNAVKYGDSVAPITVTAEADGDEVRIGVHNEGPPIKPEDQLALFDPFRRTVNGRQSGKQGWGIGLTMVRGAAEAHGGRVSVESAEGAGTTFTVTLLRDVSRDAV